MYDANESYEVNYDRGPQPHLNKCGFLPKVEFLAPPQFSVWGIPLHLPFGVPAGPLLNAMYVNAALDAGFCVPTYKTVRSVAHYSHPHPNVLSVHFDERNETADGSNPSLEPFLGNVTGVSFEDFDYRKPQQLSITNSFGVPSKSVSEWTQDFQRVAHLQSKDPTSELKEPSKLVATSNLIVLSFQGTHLPGSNNNPTAYAEDSARAACLARTALALRSNELRNNELRSTELRNNELRSTELRSSELQNLKFASGALEINLSCPNEKGAPIFF
jgi:dihydroorotate dehydrogenase